MVTDRQELFKRLWAMANDVRGAVDGWDFKQYVYGTLFYRYLSERLEAFINDDEAEGYAYKDETDVIAIDNLRSSVVDELGYFIEPQNLFCHMVERAKAGDDPDLNLTLIKILNDIVASAPAFSEHAFKDIFGDVDTNSIRLGGTVQERNKRLSKVILGVAALDIPDVSESDIDVFGDMFEYLASNYAANAGKSGGEFYTPQEVSELLAGIATYGKREINKGYDMCCGSGSLLLKLKHATDGSLIKVRDGFYGQEINVSTYNLCRMNMLLHDINPKDFRIELGDTLMNHKHRDTEPFDAIVSNPPYSTSWEGKDNPVLCADARFNKTAMAPKGKADMAFVLHALSCLSDSGTAAIVCFPGVLYRSGAEAKIRQYLVDNNYLDTIIQLPNDLFFGTSISTSIVVLKKCKTDQDVLFIDASKECRKATNRNILEPVHRDKILKLYGDRQNIECFASLVSKDKIAEFDYNLSIGMYVEKPDTREVIDIDVLEKEISETVARERKLRTEIDGLVSMLRKGLTP